MALAIVLAIIAALFSTSAYAQPLPLRLVRDYPLPGRTTRFDYESFDSKSGLLFIAHLGDSEVLVFDTKSQKLVAKIPGVSQVHGVLAVPSLNRVYASATGVNKIFAIGERNFRIIARIPSGHYPDGLAYDPTTRKLFVSDEIGQTDTVIDTTTERRIATIHLGGQAGNTQFDPESGRMYVDVQTLNRLTAIDPKTDKIVASYPLSGCRHDHGLAIDAARRLAFIACDGNAKLLTFDLEQTRVTGIHSVGRDPDVLALDLPLGRLYVASESGVVTVFREKNRGVVKIGESYLAREAHSVAVDLHHMVYFPLQDLNGRPVLRIMASADNPNGRIPRNEESR